MHRDGAPQLCRLRLLQARAPSPRARSLPPRRRRRRPGCRSTSSRRLSGRARVRRRRRAPRFDPCTSVSGSRPRASAAGRSRAARRANRRARAASNPRRRRPWRRSAAAPRSARTTAARPRSRVRDVAPDLLPVVGHVGRPVAAAAGVARLRLGDVFAHAAAQGIGAVRERAHSTKSPVPIEEPNRGDG